MTERRPGIPAMVAYGIGMTPLMRCASFAPSGNLCVKLEKQNPGGSIKDRAAYYMFRSVLESPAAAASRRLVESTSGNLGASLARFAREFDFSLRCVIDPTTAAPKIEHLRAAGAEVEFVTAPDGDHRSARLRRAAALAASGEFHWTNQYANPANVRAHEETTGVEIYEQTKGAADIVVVAVGSGGTVCGVGRALKRRKPGVDIVAVEPAGSTIFGGAPAPFLNVGAGLRAPSILLQQYGDVIDAFARVEDAMAIREALEFARSEGVEVGITSGMTLAIARRVAAAHPRELVVAVAPDGADNYDGLMTDRGHALDEPKLEDAREWRTSIGTSPRREQNKETEPWTSRSRTSLRFASRPRP